MNPTPAQIEKLINNDTEINKMTHTKKPHKHRDMMKAYAGDSSLCVLIYNEDDDKWIHTNPRAFFDYPYFEFFICLPKHKEACLHWLNGGLIECNSKLTEGWEVCFDYNKYFWKPNCGMMREDANYRIKPKNVKRWVAFKWDNFYVLPRHYETKEGAEKAAASSMMGEFQYKEIEVEV